MIWNNLKYIEELFITEFEKTGQEIQELGMEEFNQPGWVNRVWTSESYRRAHIDIVDARSTKKLWMMHCCIFPHFHNNGPIFGFDVIAGEKKITGCFHDFSPTTDLNHPLIKDFTEIINNYSWKKIRDLPDWAKAIFTEDMMACGNVNDPKEILQICAIIKKSIDLYLSNIRKYNFSVNVEEGKQKQERYGVYQRQNPHTPKTMTALGLNENAVKKFIDQCLFPKIE